MDYGLPIAFYLETPAGFHGVDCLAAAQSQNQRALGDLVCPT